MDAQREHPLAAFLQLWSHFLLTHLACMAARFLHCSNHRFLSVDLLAWARASNGRYIQVLGHYSPSRAKHKFMNHIALFTLTAISVVGPLFLDFGGLSRCQNPEGLCCCIVVGSINPGGVREASSFRLLCITDQGQSGRGPRKQHGNLAVRPPAKSFKCSNRRIGRGA